MSKTSADKAPADKTAARDRAAPVTGSKAAPKRNPKPAPAASKPAGKAAAKTPVKAAHASATVESPVESAAPARRSAPRALSGKAARALTAPPPPTLVPASTSRFADRFAPPRPPTRQMANLDIDTPRTPHKADPRLANAWKTRSGRELTEPELLAMPEAEYMNDKQLDFFRARLEELKHDLLSNADQTTENLREDTSIVPDPADRATIEEEHALELRTRDRERKLMKKISQSLVRIESADYGFCDETGEPIGLGRLIARPTATLSLEAQQRRELKQKMFGD